MCSGLMVSVLFSGSSAPGSTLARVIELCSVGKTIYSHKASLHSKCINRQLNAGDNPALDYHHIQGKVEILLVASCYRNRDKLPPDGPSVMGQLTHMQT